MKFINPANRIQVSMGSYHDIIEIQYHEYNFIYWKTLWDIT